MFPSIDSLSWLKAVKGNLEARLDQFSPTASIIEVLKLSLEYKKHFLQREGNAQGLHV